MTLASRVPILFGLILLAGCGVTDPETWDDRRADLEWARALWSDTDPGSYEYVLFRGCFCAGPVGHFEVTVTGGVVTAAVSRADGEPVPDSELEELLTVEDLFDIVDAAVQGRADGFEVRYDPDFGYPTLIDLDRNRQTVDDELRIEADSLMPRLETGP